MLRHSLVPLLTRHALFAQVNVVSMLFMTYLFIFSGVFQPLSQTSVPQLAYTNPLYYAECLLARIVFLEGTTYEPFGYNRTTNTPPLVTRQQVATLR